MFFRKYLSFLGSLRSISTTRAFVNEIGDRRTRKQGDHIKKRTPRIKINPFARQEVETIAKFLPQNNRFLIILAMQSRLSKVLFCNCNWIKHKSGMVLSFLSFSQISLLQERKEKNILLKRKHPQGQSQYLNIQYFH